MQAQSVFETAPNSCNRPSESFMAESGRVKRSLPMIDDLWDLVEVADGFRNDILATMTEEEIELMSDSMLSNYIAKETATLFSVCYRLSVGHDRVHVSMFRDRDLDKKEVNPDMCEVCLDFGTIYTGNGGERVCPECGDFEGNGDE